VKHRDATTAYPPAPPGARSACAPKRQRRGGRSWSTGFGVGESAHVRSARKL